MGRRDLRLQTVRYILFIVLESKPLSSGKRKEVVFADSQRLFLLPSPREIPLLTLRQGPKACDPKDWPQRG